MLTHCHMTPRPTDIRLGHVGTLGDGEWAETLGDGEDGTQTTGRNRRRCLLGSQGGQAQDLKALVLSWGRWGHCLCRGPVERGHRVTIELKHGQRLVGPEGDGHPARCSLQSWLWLAPQHLCHVKDAGLALKSSREPQRACHWALWLMTRWLRQVPFFWFSFLACKIIVQDEVASVSPRSLLSLPVSPARQRHSHSEARCARCRVSSLAGLAQSAEGVHIRQAHSALSNLSR